MELYVTLMERGNNHMFDIYKRWFTALEFNSSTIRVCSSAYFKNKRTIVRCFSFEAKDSESETSHKLRNVFLKNNIKTKHVVLMLPRYIAISRLLRLPSSEERQLKEMVKLRIQRESFAADNKDLIYDWRVVGVDKEGYTIISVFISSKGKINRYLSIMDKAGIVPETVTLSTSGFLSLPLKSKKCIYVLNVDQGMSDFNVLLDGYSIFSRTFLSPCPKDPAYFACLSKELKVCFELSRRLSGLFFEHEEKLYLTGVTEGLKEEDLLSCFKMPYEIFKPDVSLPVNLPISFFAVANFAHGNNSAVIDLTPVEFKEQLRINKKLRQRKILAYICTSIYLALTIFAILSINIKLKTLDLLRVKLESSALLEVEAKQFRLMSIIERRVSDSWSFLDLICELYRVSPTDLFLDSFEMDRFKEASWKGRAPEARVLFTFLANLRKDRLFQSLRLEHIDSGNKKAISGVSFKMLKSG